MLASCGTSGNDERSAGTLDEAEDSKTINGRKLIAELKQTNDDPKIRNEAAVKAVNNIDEYVYDQFGGRTPELEEDFTVQAIEGPAAIAAMEQVYGGHDGFNKNGVAFFTDIAKRKPITVH